MDSNSLIKETLKYLETDENNQPKYRFEVYKSGISNYYKDKIKVLSRGLIKTNTKEEDTIPVSVYTIGDVFDTIKGTSSDILADIKALPDTLENIKVSLKDLGYSALDSAIDTIKAAVVPIEVIQTINDVYRVARPLVEKIVDIASIMFYYESAAKVTQDVLQYLTRLSVSTAKNYLDKLWGIFLDTPIFAVYENDETLNLSGAYASFAAEANRLIDNIINDSETFRNVMIYANNSGETTYEPKYSDFGINVNDDISDVCSDINRKIYILTRNTDASNIYVVNNNYSTTQIFTTPEDIQKIFCYDNSVFYITNNKTVKRVISDEVSTTTLEINGAEFSVINSSPALLYNSTDNKLYSPISSSPIMSIGNVIMHTYDANNNVIYFIIESIENNETIRRIKAVLKSSGSYIQEELGELTDTVYSMSYFDGILYLVLKNNNNEYYISKINAGISFNRLEYATSKKPNGNIIWIDETYATDGLSVYTHNGNLLTYVTPTYTPINCITYKENDSKKYYVCSSGIHLYVTEISESVNGNSYLWNVKDLVSNISSNVDEIKVPDNIAGLKWYKSDSMGEFLFAYSQNCIYVIGPDKVPAVFNVASPIKEDDEPLLYKEFKSFDNWFDYQQVEQERQLLEYSSKFSVKNDCIITAISVINKQIYVALYNPKYYTGSNLTKCGIYKAAVNFVNGVYGISIDYNNPVVTSESSVKIYSFMYNPNCWYYTDGKKLYNYTNSSETDLKINSAPYNDGALFLTAEDDSIVLYTAKARMNSVLNKEYGEVTTLANYKTTALPQIASTRNTLMFSDGNYVYNIVNNGEDDINYDIFQICYKKTAFDYRLIQSCDSVFVVSRNSIKKVPLYSSITSSNYGCGYNTDTTPNTWHGAAPYYFASNVLNNNKSAKQRELFILSFRENFKVELTKLLQNIPDAFVAYAQNMLIEQLKKSGIKVDGDDGQIADLIIKSISSTTANSIGMYVQQKFFEKTGDDLTYETFANQVYNKCISDAENKMTDDFYAIAKELFNSILEEIIPAKETGGLAPALLKYYQNHKAEWATSMSELIDVDTVDPKYYEIPLNSGYGIKKTTYRFSYPDDEYKFEYIPNPSSKFLSKNIINGYYYEGPSFIRYEEVEYPVDEELSEYYELVNDEYIHTQDGSVNPNKTYYYKVIVSPGFYEDPEYTTEIDPKTKIGDDYYDADGNVICYGDGNDNYYTYKLQDYILTEDTTPEKEYYYQKTGDNQYIYSLTEDTYEHANKPYFEVTYVLTNDTSVVSEKTYYSITGGDYEYNLKDASEFPILPNGSYFIKQQYSKTLDEEVFVEGKNYYIESYAPATGSIDNNTQYYERKYVPTEDTEIDNNKNYYEFLILDNYDSNYYRYNPSAPIKYKIKYTQAPVNEPLNPGIDYYRLEGSVFKLVRNVDSQLGPYYIVSGFEQDNVNGEYELVQFTESTAYSLVVNPVLDNLASYYEQKYVPVGSVDSLVDKFVKVYELVENPISVDWDLYYEENDSYVEAENLTYEYDINGNVIGIKNDRRLYEINYIPEVVTIIIPQPGDNPKQNGWYEKNKYNQVISGTFNNPKDSGLYERSINEIAFQQIIPQPGDNPKQNGWYDYSYSYSTLYDDGKVYIDLGAVEYESNFDTEDGNWHKGFYDEVKAAGEAISPSASLSDAKAQALASLNEIKTTRSPSDDWQMLIAAAVSDYIAKQEEQYKDIVEDSNMYPIQWNELPSKINQRAFDYALTALLYAIKQRLLANIAILVGGGKVKCYSCADAATIIDKIIDKNAIIWSNQIRFAKSKVTAAKTTAEVISSFRMIEAYDPTRYILKSLVDKQSKLYANYIDQLIEAQIINDNDTEVMM